MANNRLWIVDTESDERFLLAKSFGDDWQLQFAEVGKNAVDRIAELNEWLNLRGASNLKLVTESE